jgi:hypothetical protein
MRQPKGEIMDIAIGKHVDGWCTRCKLVLRHTIESMTGAKIKRTHCNTCGAQHAHRAGPPRARDEQKIYASKYAALLRGRTESASRPYSRSVRFTVGEVISHTTLGLGIVTAERERTKIDILFPDGQKVLLQGC